MLKVHVMIRFVRLAAAAALVASAAPAVHAQGNVGAPAAAASGASSAAAMPGATRGPTLNAATVGVRATESQSLRLANAPAFQQNRSNRNSLSLMIVGATALLVGAVIGDDAGTIIMVGGAVIGLWGLYNFLN